MCHWHWQDSNHCKYHFFTVNTLNLSLLVFFQIAQRHSPVILTCYGFPRHVTHMVIPYLTSFHGTLARSNTQLACTPGTTRLWLPRNIDCLRYWHFDNSQVHKITFQVIPSQIYQTFFLFNRSIHFISFPPISATPLRWPTPQDPINLSQWGL